jgi:hypothetical protein
MKIIKDLDITVTYRVGFGDIEVPDDVFEQLKEIHGNYIKLSGTGLNYPEASEWLRKNIKERDCYYVGYEINEI